MSQYRGDKYDYKCHAGFTTVFCLHSPEAAEVSVVAGQGSEIRPSVGQLADRVRLLVGAREDWTALQETLCAIFWVFTAVLLIQISYDITILGLS